MGSTSAIRMEGLKHSETELSNTDHSAATTEASSPRSFFYDGDDMVNTMPAKWEQVRDSLVAAALDGQENVHRYGDMITCRETIERFLAGAKGNVEKAAKQLQAHLDWRTEYMLDGIVDEDFSDLEDRQEIYWGGSDLQGVPTLTWLIGKHLPSNQCPKRFVRFFVYQIEKGLRTSPKYPNAMFNIFVELTDAGFHSIDGNVAALLQPILMKNYPKVRKGMFVFPVNWFVQLCWNTVLKPLISSLQPDIEDKICPLYGDYRPQLFARFAQDQVEVAFGGTLDLAHRPSIAIIPYKSTPLNVVLDLQRKHREATVSALHAARHLASEKLVVLQAEAKAASRKQRRSVQQHMGGTSSVSTDNGSLALDTFATPPSRGLSALYYLSLVILGWMIWNGVTFWPAFSLGLIACVYSCSYFFQLPEYVESSNVQGADSQVVFAWANPSYVDRDTAAILQRLEDERTSGTRHAGTKQNEARSVWDRAVCLFIDYAKKCGI